jgi:uracil-DNA glycosylase
MDGSLDYYGAKALLEWQIDLGVTETISESPVNRYEVPEKAPKLVSQAAPEAPAKAPKVDPVAEAEKMARAAGSLEELEAALADFPHCELKKGARNLVFARGNPAARVMVIAGAPGRDADRSGQPLAGADAGLFDKMFAAIGLGLETPDAGAAIYLSLVLPWRPPQDRPPNPAEIEMLMPFVARHVELADPDILVLMGNTPCLGVLGRKGITRLRGRWVEAFGRPALPMVPPAQLMGKPLAKRDAWADLLSLQAKLHGRD